MCQVGYLSELYPDARSPEYKIFLTFSINQSYVWSIEMSNFIRK